MLLLNCCPQFIVHIRNLHAFNSHATETQPPIDTCKWKKRKLGRLCDCFIPTPRCQKIRFLVLTSKFQSLQCGNVIATAALFKERRPVTLLIFIAWVAVKKVSFYWPRWTHQIILGKHSLFFDNVESQQQRHFFCYNI